MKNKNQKNTSSELPQKENDFSNFIKKPNFQNNFKNIKQVRLPGSQHRG